MILCGGAGTRLWPVSRQLFPKHLLPLMGDQSLLQQTAQRLSGEQFAPAIVVSGEDQRFFIKRQLASLRAPRSRRSCSSQSARNTSAAAALAAAWIRRNGSDELLLLMPSDHVIGDREAFMQAIETRRPARRERRDRHFRRPRRPSPTLNMAISRRTPTALARRRFPHRALCREADAETAAEYLASGRFFWNSGIFLLKASTLLDEMRQFLPASLDPITRSVAKCSVDGLFVRPAAEAFEQAENISIDHGIMEKTARGVVVPVEMDWSDVGSWDAVWKLGAKDEDDNVIQGDVVALDTRNSLLAQRRRRDGRRARPRQDGGDRRPRRRLRRADGSRRRGQASLSTS